MRTAVALLLFILIIFPHEGYTSHIKAGEVSYSVSGLHVQITVTCYSDRSGVELGQGVLDFGDGESIGLSPDDWNKHVLTQNQGIIENSLTIAHTYPSSGLFRIGYTEQNRNAGILNINLGNSVNIPFYIESTLMIDPIVPTNHSPVFHNAPVDNAALYQKFTHNPWATDPDGDSLSFALIIPRDANDSEVPHYRFPGHPGFNSIAEDDTAPVFGFNSYTGQLVWDSPGMAGEYNIAFKVVEWRKIDTGWTRIGAVTRDMQVLVEAISNGRPRVNVPEDTVVVAGTSYRLPIIYEDPEEDSITVHVFSELIESGAATIDYSTNGEENTVFFEWAPGKEEERTLPYTIFVKVVDNPPENGKLATYKAFRMGYNRSSMRLADAGEITGAEEPADWDLKIFPNPSRHKIRLEGSGHKNMQILIIDLYGNFLIHNQWQEGMQFLDIDVRAFPPGIYLLILKNKASTQQHKIVVK